MKKFELEKKNFTSVTTFLVYQVLGSIDMNDQMV